MPSKPVRDYTRWWYQNASQTCLSLRWMGVSIVKNPLDLFVYQEILWQTRPALVIETGAFVGGSALYLAHVMDAIHDRDPAYDGQIVSLDIATDRPLPEHPRIEFRVGLSSTDPSNVEYLTEQAKGVRTMVILDSDHSCNHVLAELDAYAALVTQGCFLIVEDTNREGYYLGGNYPAGGPHEALKQWQPKNKGFEPDPDCERMGVTQNPGGYLCRVR